MRQKFNYLFIGLLFSGLAFFSYLFLLLYSDFTPQHLEVLISFKSFILILAAFNLVGFGVLMIHNWQKRSFQFLVKRKERLIIDCILTAIILFLMNYLVLSIVKAIFDELKLPNVLGKVWTTDAIYRETKAKFDARKREGCIAVEMELAGVQAVCDFYGWELYNFLVTGDVLDQEVYDVTGLADANHNMDKLYVAIEIAKRI